MQTQNRFLDDVARLVGDGIGMAIKCANQVKECVSDKGATRDVRPSTSSQEDKIDRIYEMMSNSRSDTEDLRDKIDALEQEIQKLKNKK